MRALAYNIYTAFGKGNFFVKRVLLFALGQSDEEHLYKNRTFAGALR